MIGTIVNYFTNAGCSINEIQKEKYLMDTLERIKNSKTVGEKAQIIGDYERREKANKAFDMLSNILITGVSCGFSYLIYDNVKSSLKTTNKRIRNCSKYINDENYSPSRAEEEALLIDLGLETFEDYYYGSDEDDE